MEGREQIPGVLQGPHQSGVGDGSAWSWPSGGTAVSLVGIGKVSGNISWWVIHGEMFSVHPGERTGPQQELQSCLPSQVWSSENRVV